MVFELATDEFLNSSTCSSSKKKKENAQARTEGVSAGLCDITSCTTYTAGEEFIKYDHHALSYEEVWTNLSRPYMRHVSKQK